MGKIRDIIDFLSIRSYTFEELKLNPEKQKEFEERYGWSLTGKLLLWLSKYVDITPPSKYASSKEAIKKEAVFEVDKNILNDPVYYERSFTSAIPCVFIRDKDAFRIILDEKIFELGKNIDSIDLNKIWCSYKSHGSTLDEILFDLDLSGVEEELNIDLYWGIWDLILDNDIMSSGFLIDGKYYERKETDKLFGFEETSDEAFEKQAYEKGYTLPGHKYLRRERKRKPGGGYYYRYYYTRPYGEKRPSIVVEPETKPEYGEEYMRVRITPTPKMRNTIKLIHNAFTKDEGGYWRMPISAMDELLDRKLDILASPELMATYDRYVSGALQRNMSKKLKGVDIEPEVLKWNFDIFGLTKEKVETVANNLFGNKLIDQYDRQFLIKLRRKYDTFEELKGRRQRVKAISIQKDVNTMLSTRLDIKRDIFGKLNVSPTFDYDSSKETSEFKLPDYFSKDFNLTGGDLWDYEKKGCNWLLNQKRGLLGFGTGLGKTVISIASACKLLDAGKAKHILCVVPSGRKEGWEEEIVRRTGKKVLVIDGTREKRKKLWRKVADYDFIVCSYDITRIDGEQIPFNKFNCVIADESTRLRNLETMRTKSFRERMGGVEYLWFLSGTPIPNHPLNLFSQLAILNPAVLGSKRAFLRKFCIRKKVAGKTNTILGWKNMDDLHRLIKSYVFYKGKDAPDVNHDIPKFRSFSMKVDMGPKQTDEYKKVLEGVVKEIEGMSEEEWNKRKGNMLKKIIRLEQIAISPALVPGSDWSSITPKLESAGDIIQDKLSDEGGGVLLFSFFKKPLQILYQDLLKRGLKESEISVVTGTTPKGSLLQLEKDIEAGKVRVVLASDALAEGTNLQYGLDTVINLNIPWSPGDFEQRYSRVVRQGQKRKVSVISLISKGTMEEGKLDQLKMKKSWIDRILNGKPGEEMITELTKDDMLNILGDVGQLKESMIKRAESTEASGGLWISPEGEVFDVGYFGHEDFLRDNNMGEETYDLGWVNVSWLGSGFGIIAANLDESRFKKVFREVQKFVGDEVFRRGWFVTLDNADMKAYITDIEEYGDIWRALVRGRRIKEGSIWKEAIFEVDESNIIPPELYELSFKRAVPCVWDVEAMIFCGRSHSEAESAMLLSNHLIEEDDVDFYNELKAGFLFNGEVYTRGESYDILGEGETLTYEKNILGLPPEKRLQLESMKQESMIKEGDYSQRRDSRFAPMVQESHEDKIKYIDAYRDNQLDIIASASNGVYTVLIVEFISPPQNPDAEAQTIYIKNDLPDYPVPIGWWMDWPEPRWKISEEEYYGLPRKQRAGMECQEQLDKWVGGEFNELFYGLYNTEEYDKWYWDEERTVPWNKEDREKLDEEFRERFSLDPIEFIEQSKESMIREGRTKQGGINIVVSEILSEFDGIDIEDSSDEEIVDALVKLYKDETKRMEFIEIYGEEVLNDFFKEYNIERLVEETE